MNEVEPPWPMSDNPEELREAITCNPELGFESGSSR
jgi:hypothetical protein